jgi:hypothetical protein
MTNWRKILTVVLLIIVLGGLAFGGYYLFRHKNTLANLNDNLPGTLFGPKSEEKAKELSPDKIIYWTNYYREQNGLKDLTKNDLLTEAAQKKVDDMFAKQYFEHVSPTGVSPADLVKSVGYNYKVSGENLALGDFKDEKDLVDAWMNSPGHRANILNKDYTEIGVATGLANYQDWGTTWMAVQEFGKPLPNCTAPDKNLEADINSKNTQYQNDVNQINSLNSQANADIAKGNDIYQSTHDASQAQPYWDKGNQERAQSQVLQTQAQSLQNEAKSETSTYNAQVSAYNACIKQ